MSEILYQQALDSLCLLRILAFVFLKQYLAVLKRYDFITLSVHQYDRAFYFPDFVNASI